MLQEPQGWWVQCELPSLRGKKVLRKRRERASWECKRKEESTVQFTDCMGSVEGGNLVVNRNRWVNSQEKRRRREKKDFLWVDGGNEDWEA